MEEVNLIEIIFDTTKTDLESIMMPWKAESLRYLWSQGGEMVTIRDIWEHISPLYTISRTSISQFLKSMFLAGVLENTPMMGKGGMHGAYSPRLDEEAFRGEVVKIVLTNLLDCFPKAAWEQIKAY